MNKIPVGQTIRFAYAFTFGEIGTVIGLIWIPTLAVAVISFFALRSYFPLFIDSLESGEPLTGPEAFLPLLLVIVAILVLSIVGVAISRYVLGQIQGPVFAHFAFGAAELRAFGGLVGLIFLINLFFIVLALVVGVLAAVVGSFTKSTVLGPMIAAGVDLAALAGLLFVIYAAVRLSFLLVPSAIEEGQYGMTKSWLLTRGNFWRIVAVGVSTLLPLELVREIAISAIIGPNMAPAMMTSAKDVAGLLRFLAQQLRAVQPQMPLWMGISFVISPLQYGLMFSASAFAYRALSGGASTPKRNES